MEIKVTSTGVVSRLPERLHITMVIRATGKTVSEAEELQDKRLQAVTSVLSESCVNLKFLSAPNIQELTKREEVQKEGSSVKETRWVKDGYNVYQNAEIVIDGWDTSLAYAFLSKLMTACEGNMSAKFELTETQKSEMSLEAMERSYKTAISYATKMASLEVERINTGVMAKLKMKEAKILAKDFGAEAEEGRSFGVAKQSSFAQERMIGAVAKEIIPVRKHIEVINTVEYVFENK